MSGSSSVATLVDFSGPFLSPCFLAYKVMQPRWGMVYAALRRLKVVILI